MADNFTEKSRPDTAVDRIDLTDRLSDVDDDLWVKIGSFTLHNSDKDIILTGKWLWGTHLIAVQLLLKENFRGIKDTGLAMHKDCTLSPGGVQILHINSNHWITILTLQPRDCEYDATVYDSSNSHLNHQTKMQIAKLFKTPKKELCIRMASVNKQAGYNDCGVFAAAYSIHLHVSIGKMQ